MKMDLHIHSKHSHDSGSDPRKVLKVARRKELDAIALTDHNTMAAYEHLPHPSRTIGIVLVRGMEVATECGDVIGLFLTEEVQSRQFRTVVDEIRDQGGLVVLPHPCRRSCDPRGLLHTVDLIEVINARSRDGENAEAWKMSREFRIPPVTGSDAHTYFEIGRVVTEFDGYADDPDDLKTLIADGPRWCSGKCMPYLLSHGITFVTAKMKRMVK